MECHNLLGANIATLRTHHRPTFVVLAVASAAFALLQSLVIPVLAEIQAELHTDQSTVTWVLTAYLLSASVFTPIVGRIGDRVGKEKILVLTLAALCLGSLLAALATNIAVMVVARVIQGAGGGVLPLVFGITRDEFPATEVPRVVGFMASLAAIGGGLGTTVGGWIVNVLGYHWLFWLPMLVTGATAVAAYFIVPESPVRSTGRISVGPAVLLSGWLVGSLLAVSEGPSWGWASGRVAGLLGGAALLFVLWIVVECRVESPLIDMRMMRMASVWTTNVVALLVGFGMYACFAFLPRFSQTPVSAGYGFGATISESGLILLPGSITMFLFSSYSTHAVRVIGSKFVVVLGCLIVAGSMVGFALLHDEKWQVYVGYGVLGAGMGLVFACLANLIVAAVPPHQTGVASGMNANIRTIGGALGSAVMATVVTAGAQVDGLPNEAGYTAGFLMLSGAMLVAAAVALAIPRVQRAAIESRLVADRPHPQSGMVAAGTLVSDRSE